ncbi:MAG: polysaccharide deacetylase, partial [Hyphomicrobiales bacterium]
ERTLINKATNLISSQEGIHPKGWLGPWISQSHATLDLLQEAGYEYTLDWCHDEQPIWMQTRRGRILSVPYPQELNDIPQIVARQKEGEDFANMIVDAFNTMIIESERRPLIMGIALHAYLMGYPHRIPHLRRALTHIKNQSAGRVWFTTAGEINDHFRALGL